MNPGLTYAGAGVDYSRLDPFKLRCQQAAQGTSHWLQRFGLQEISRDPTYLFEETRKSALFNRVWSTVHEGLGTKNLIADAMGLLIGRSYYDAIAQDTIAMVVNDVLIGRLLPVTMTMHLAVGDSAWFDDQNRVEALIEGWVAACNMAKCVWAGGETPTLKDVIVPATCELSGSSIGSLLPGQKWDDSIVRTGDVIVLLGSSGIHANGLTLARQIAERLSHGYLTEIGNGQIYGAALLTPTQIYVEFVETCMERRIELHNIINITGHGWRKLMRGNGACSYVIDRVPVPQMIFQFIREQGDISPKEMYGNFNMGAGMALIVDPKQVIRLKEVGSEYSIAVLEAGYVGNSKPHTKQVVIRPLDLEWEETVV
jgi:phosphoribosylformylglycinamidine cyclo-ligase